MHTITVRSNLGEYPVLIGKGLLHKLDTIAARAWPGKKAVIVTDSNVAPLYLADCLSPLQKGGFQVESMIITPGETSKTLETVGELYKAFHGAGLSRTDGVIALGGGVVGDLAGFAAATYLRGIALMQVPTTLLAQVDAAIGGKTGVNLPFGKNMVGAFYAPLAVAVDLNTLGTLGPKQRAEGMAEVIKYGCILDGQLFTELGREARDFSAIVSRCVQHKAELVVRDARDLGPRRLLNFGHTIGHALEQATGFALYTHGEAVAIGMVTALKIGEKLQITAANVRPRLVSLLKREGLPTASSVPVARLLPALASDKKRRGRGLELVLLREIGESLIHLLDMGQLDLVLRQVWGWEDG